MWTRAELKERAKEGLRKYYWYGLLVVFVAGILGAGGLLDINISLKGGTSSIKAETELSRLFDDPYMNLSAFLLIMSVIVFLWLAAICISTFLSNVVAVGKCRYFTISTLTQQNAGFEELFGCFKKGRYWNVVKVQFFRGLYEFLWGLLFVIPGIIKHYEYYMVPYLLAEYPDMDRQEVFRLSKRMMDGNKFAVWVLELSFFGWELLGILFCCIGTLFVRPYIEATYAELYLKLREQRLGIHREGTHEPDADGAVFTQHAEGAWTDNWQ